MEENNLNTLLNQYHLHSRVYEIIDTYRKNLNTDIILDKIPSVEEVNKKRFSFSNFLSNYFAIHYSKHSNPKLDRPTLFVGDQVKVKFSLKDDPLKYRESTTTVTNPSSFLNNEYIQFANKFNLNFSRRFQNTPVVLSISLVNPDFIPLSESNSFFNACLLNFLNHYFQKCVGLARISHAQSTSRIDPYDPDKLLIDLFIHLVDEEHSFSDNLNLATDFFVNSPNKTAKYRKVSDTLKKVQQSKDCGYFLVGYDKI